MSTCEGSNGADTTAEVSPAHAAAKYASPHIANLNATGQSIDLVTRTKALTMDEQRKEHVAYEYLCHLEEAKKWIEACIEEELPATTDLEQALRNGVIMCKLGHYYAPEVLPIRRIYDLDESKYKMKGLHFKHTDNFNFWLKSLQHIGLPKIFYPETTDLYDRKNMPRVVYCIHALSLYLHKLGIAPEIEDLVGTVTFSEEEISTMKKELEKYGINMPSFGKIGGILANEMSVDEAAVHAAVLAINSTVDDGDPAELLMKLRNPAAMIDLVEEENAQRYLSVLQSVKVEKSSGSGDRDDEQDIEQADAYDYMLTQTEIQGCVSQVNIQVKREIAEAKLHEALNSINQAVVSGDKQALLSAILVQEARLTGVISDNIQWYMDILTRTQRDSSQTGEFPHLSKEEIQDIILIANQIAEHTRLVEAAVLSVNESCDDEETLLTALSNEHLALSDVIPTNITYYSSELKQRSLDKKREGDSGLLTEDEIQSAVYSSNDIAEHDHNVTQAIDSISTCANQEDSAATIAALTSSLVQLEDVDSAASDRYHQRLRQAVQEKGEPLSLEEIASVVSAVNQDINQERQFSAAISAVNSSSTPDQLIESLSNELVNIEHVDPSVTPLYLTLLNAAKERAGHLTKDEIQAIVDRGNAHNVDGRHLAEAVHHINKVVEEQDGCSDDEMLAALKDPSLAMRSITDECAHTYCEKLAVAKATKQEQLGENASMWAEHRTREGYNCYYHTECGQLQWATPTDESSCGELSREEIQTIVTKVTADYDRWALLKSNEPLIITLQGWWRGAIVRQRHHQRMTYLKEQEPHVIKLQAQLRGLRQRKAYRDRMSFLKTQTAVIMKIQSLARMRRARQQYRARLDYLRANVNAVVKIQAFWRAKQTKKDYTQLVEVAQPPASAVRKFLSLLEQSDLDFTEELECQRLKAQVVQQIRANQQLEQDLSVMDIKIGLLVRNRISLQDVVSHQNQVRRRRGKSGGQGAGADDPSQTGIGGLSKANQEKIEAYQHLFYQLQITPHYFAKLIFEMSPGRTNQFMENVILTVLNYAQNMREQYLLVKLFETALVEEIESKVFKVSDIITGNPTVIKMVVHYTRGIRGQNILRELLGPLIMDFLKDKDLVLNTSPVDVYKAWVNNMESETGEKSKLPYEVSNDQALEHEEVRERVASTIQILRDSAERFQQTILSSIDKIPYAMRFIAMRLRQALHSRFPEATEEEILKVVGNLLYYRYMNPALVAPDAFDIVDLGVEQALSMEQRRNLGAVAKVLQHAAAGKLFEGENAALSSMNGYIQSAFGRFRQFFLEASTVEQPNDRFGYDEYTDVIQLTKPVIYISVKEIIRTHSLLVEHEDAVAPDTDDPIREILRDLGPIPSAEALLGGVREALHGEDVQDIISEASKQELALTLTNKFEGFREADSSDMKALFVRTKRMVVDMLRVQPGENLTEVLYTPATHEQEGDYRQMLADREKAELEKSIRSAKLKKSESLYGDKDLPLEGVKRKIMRQLRTLEQEDMVSSGDNYQEIINAIAKDIRNQHRHRQQRKHEICKLQETLDKLNEKAQFFEEQMEYYHEYVKACLENLAKAGIRAGGKGEQFKKQTVKYSAQRLHDKGVVLEIEGLPQSQFRNASIEITSVKPGVFEVTGRVLGVTMDKVELVFQDLLQLQYEGVAVMKMFNRAKINVNLLIYLINKKFYGRS